MNIIEIKNQIDSLAKMYHAIDEQGLDEIKDAENAEEAVEKLIIDYCEHNGYQVQGFPHEKRVGSSDEFDDDYFSQERYRMYLDNLAILHDDVAELMWHYVNSFWPDFYENKDAYITDLKHNLDTGLIYDINF